MDESTNRQISVPSRVVEVETKIDIPNLDLNKWMGEIIEKSERIRKEVTKRTLIRSSVATNNMFALFIECLREEGLAEVTTGYKTLHIDISLDDLNKIPNPESYLRARRSLIENAVKENNEELLDKIMPSNPLIREAMIQKEKSLREFYKNEC